MICTKKAFRDELLQLALILSLLRSQPDLHYDSEYLFNAANSFDVDNGTSWRSMRPEALIRSRQHVHPKGLDSLLMNYERQMFADLHSLGRYRSASDVRADYQTNITAYHFTNAESAATPPATSAAIPEDEARESVVDESLQLTQEDMDLIEVLWKQDVDLGVSLEVDTMKSEKSEVNVTFSPPDDDDDNYVDQKLKELTEDGIKIEPVASPENDPWAGLNYTIDTETGEYVIKDEFDPLIGDDCGAASLGDLSFQFPELSLLDRILDDDSTSQVESVAAKELDRLVKSTEESGAEEPNDLALPFNSDADLDTLQNMIQTSQFHHPHHHHRAFQSRMPFVRTMSVEQRWQDLANLLSLPNPNDSNGMQHPFPHHHHHHHHTLHNFSHPHSHSMSYASDSRSVLLHNATLNAPMGDINSSYANLGNAVATSMNLTNSSEPMAESGAAPHYKVEPSHDMMYYQNSTSEYNQADGGLFGSFLNDEDLQLMDMAMNEGMYTMRMMDGNTTAMGSAMGMQPASSTGSTSATGHSIARMESERVDTSSDSAVSSMGSERVPSISDGEWCDGGSDSGHTAGDHYATDFHAKYRPYDYSYRQHSLAATAGATGDTHRLLPVAQKKHQMFGKRCFQQDHPGPTSAAMPHPAAVPIKYEYGDGSSSNASVYSPSHADVSLKAPPESKYSCALEFGRQHYLPRNHLDHVQHNHTYHIPAENNGAMQRPTTRDKVKIKKSDEEHLTRDEKRARALNVPITVDDIINLPMDEFNERLSKYDLSEAQLSLIRDIRRRGKNKVAAQNCRKRKLDQIICLADEVKDMRDRKVRLLTEHEYLTSESHRVKDKYQQLYRHVFQNLRDAEGNHYSPYQYSLQTSADGSILVVPRASGVNNNTECKDPQNPAHKE